MSNERDFGPKANVLILRHDIQLVAKAGALLPTGFRQPFEYFVMTHDSSPNGKSRFLPDQTHFPGLGPWIARAELEQAGARVEMGSIFNPELLNRATTGESHNLYLIAAMDLSLDVLREIAAGAKHPERIVACGKGVTADSASLREEFPWMTQVVGNCEGVLRGLMADWEKGQMDSLYQMSTPYDLKDYRQEPYMAPDNRWKREKSSTFFRLMEASRGCVHECHFCLQGGHFTRKALNDVIWELRTMEFHPGEVLFFPDDNLTLLPKDWLREIFGEVNRLKRPWIGEGEIANIIDDHELLGIMGKYCLSFLSGLEDVEFGVPGVRGKVALSKNLREVVRQLREAHFPVHFTVVFGTDDQDPGIFERTALILDELGITVSSHIATPFVGTEFYRNLKAEGRLIDHHSMERDRDHLLFEPKHMTAEQLIEGITWFRYHNASGIRQRLAADMRYYGPVKALALAGTGWTGDRWGAHRWLKRQPDLIAKVEEQEKAFQRRAF